MIEFEHGTTSGSRVLRVDREVKKRQRKTFAPGGSEERLDVQAGGDGDVHGGEEQGLLLHQDRAGGRLQLRVQLGGDLASSCLDVSR